METWQVVSTFHWNSSKCSFDVSAEAFWDRKPVLQNNAEQSKLTALNNNSKSTKNSAHAPLNHDDGSLLPNTYLHLIRKRQPIIDGIKGPLDAAFRSPLMKALDRSVETLGLWIVTSSVTFIKSVNQSSIKPCLIVHLVAMWTLMCFTHVLAIYLPVRVQKLNCQGKGVLLVSKRVTCVLFC